MTSHECHVVSNHLSFCCLFNSLCGPTSKKYQCPHYWPFVSGIHRWPVNSPHKGPETWIKLPFGGIIMIIKLHNMFPSVYSLPPHHLFLWNKWFRVWVLIVYLFYTVLYAILHFTEPNSIKTWLHADGIVHERCNSSVLAMELCFSCTNPLIWWKWFHNMKQTSITISNIFF